MKRGKINTIKSFFNEDCIEGCRKHIPDNSVDLIITDPPYGIEGDKLHKHYHRKEEFVIDDYIEIPEKEYPEFSLNWIKEAERILRPGASMYIISGYTNLIHILNALKETTLKEINHIIWKYNFGVYTRNKFVSSHYHILYYVKPGKKPLFNIQCRFGQDEKNENKGSLNYLDREDVWIISREYKHGKKKNKNELPKELLTKMIQYSSNAGDLVCDLFLGSFSTAKVAIGLNRKATGFEKSSTAYKYQIKEMEKVIPGSLITGLKKPIISGRENEGKRWGKDEKENLFTRFDELYPIHKTKRKCIDVLCEEYGRGYFSILNVLSGRKEKDERDNREKSPSCQTDLFE
jgi:site-specific DNA-methyltransferase (adenine-specific)